MIERAKANYFHRFVPLGILVGKEEHESGLNLSMVAKILGTCQT